MLIPAQSRDLSEVGEDGVIESEVRGLRAPAREVHGVRQAAACGLTQHGVRSSGKRQSTVGSTNNGETTREREREVDRTTHAGRQHISIGRQSGYTVQHAQRSQRPPLDCMPGPTSLVVGGTGVL